MNNAVMMLVYNQTPEQLSLTKEAVASALAQDIPVDLFLIDNGSTDDTWEWMQSVKGPNVILQRYMENNSPVRLCNMWMKELFGRLGYEYILAIPNDVVMPTFLYSSFLQWPRGIVTGSWTHDRNYDINAPIEAAAISENTPLALVLYRRWAWQALIAKDGYFMDERYTHYCSDCDWALRTASCGIRGIQLNIPYWHYGSASHKLAPPEIGDAIRREADVDRQRFYDKWGFYVFDEQYSKSALDINFRG